MQAYIIRRVLLIIPTLLLVTLIVFFLVRMIPGTVVDLMAEEMASAGGWGVGPSTEFLKKSLGLDVPVHVQYFRWLSGAIRGDFGQSLWRKTPILPEIAARLPVSLELGFLALITAVLMALPIGIYSAVRQDTVFDYLGRSVAIVFLSVPNFWIGTMVMVYPAIWWGWSPRLEYVPLAVDPARNLLQFIIPAVIMGAAMSGGTMRMMRTMMLEVLRQDYVRTAWSKGLSERTVIMRHAMKNALIPVVTIIGLQLPILIGGAIILEQIFGLPGIGRYLLVATTTRDYTVVSAMNVILAAFVLFVNLIVDLTYAYLDPRVHYK